MQSFTHTRALLRLLIISSSLLATTNGQFILYKTDRWSSSQLEYDCLYYRVSSGVYVDRSYSPNNGMPHQIVAYCMRPAEEEMNSSSLPFLDNIIELTFAELHLQNVTAHALLLRSAPIELAERYQQYIDQTFPGDANQTFLSCSTPWFGPSCQYTFDFSLSAAVSFTEIVRHTFAVKAVREYAHQLPLTNLTCYRHLVCHRGPEPMCLDWREICDGKIDCIDSGVDEAFCSELEVNECNPDEYRCHNGMCIPDTFVRDDPWNPECLDATDEGTVNRYMKSCLHDPTFRCEERACRRQIREFACGDGECDVDDSHVLSEEHVCNNGRQQLRQRALLAAHAGNEACWSAMACLLRIVNFHDGECEGVCKTSLTRCILSPRSNCPRPYFFFPSYPIFFGHVYLLFDPSRLDYWTNRAPDFVCYDRQLCPFLPWTMKINESSCADIRQLGFPHVTEYWNTFTSQVHEIFATCGRNSHSFELFHCNNATKSISTHRLLDGVNDCADGSDEKIQNSCALANNQRRLKCSSENETQCIAPVLIQDGIVHCTTTGEDEITSAQRQQQKRISFGTLCDGFIEMSDPELNETDESYCEMWPCNNLYTRCDQIWNCLNRADELQCHSSPCRSNEHPCLSIYHNQLICLPLNRTDDGIIDCRGAVDEHAFCRSTYASRREKRYRCLNDTKCIAVHDVCGVTNGEKCSLGDDEWNCSRRTDPIAQHLGLCQDMTSEQLSIGAIMLCTLSDYDKRSTVYFSLSNEQQRQVETVVANQSIENTATQYAFGDYVRAWSCNRGIPVRLSNNEEKCLCPPSYYGRICQYQNQRVSLTLTFRTQEWRTEFHFVIILADSSGNVHSYEHVVHVPSRDCNMKYQVYLLYRTRPKSLLHNYSVQIDVFVKKNLDYRASWRLPIRFAFLPVYRLSALLIIPTQRAASDCERPCQHGICTVYEDTSEQFCRCESDWSGPLCDTETLCTCSSDALCVGHAENRSICVCPTGKLGPRCYLIQPSCQSNPCEHGGQCVPTEAQILSNNFTCLCPEGFSGLTCQLRDSRIDISFRQLTIPDFIRGHFITVQNNADPLRTDILKKVPVDRKTVTLYMSAPFHLLFGQIHADYYLLVSQVVYRPSIHILLTATPAQRCAPLYEVLNATFLDYPPRRRVKYYHTVCQDRRDLFCFYDETFMCLCTEEQHANCFEFVHHMISDCQTKQYCEHGGTCLQDHSSCPTTFLCTCADCYYGSKCQFTTIGSGLSLDTILGYHISPHVTIHRQPSVVRMSIAITTVMFALTLLSSVLCILTFRRKKIREMGCGIYLLALSNVSLLTMTIFVLKFWFLLLSQMKTIVHRRTLYVNCLWIEFLLKCLPYVNDWLSACVAIERVLTIHSGASFKKKKSKQTARWVVAIVLFGSIATAALDPLHRQLIDDVVEQRTWCVAAYSSHLQTFNRVTDIIHFFGPFAINFISASLIIIQAARQRFATRQQMTLMQHLWQQLREHKHLIISPCFLIVLALPRLIISFIWNCLKSVREPWLFLAGYFLSFVAPMTVFVVFVLPSTMYKKEFSDAMKQLFGRETPRR